MVGVVNGYIPDDFMTDTSTRLSAMHFEKESYRLEVIDQLKLPHQKIYISIHNSQDAFNVIRSMQVRGAPLIAMVATLGLYLDIHSAYSTFVSAEDVRKFVKGKAEFLVTSRPTAINLKNAMGQVIEAMSSSTAVDDIINEVNNKIFAIYDGEQEENRRLVWNGYQEVVSACPTKKKLTLMTICNTGSLATHSWGTALGVIFALHQAGRVEMVYALETRPYNQGARLTATELLHNKVPFKLITDSMAGWAMKVKAVDAVVVGKSLVFYRH